MCVWATRQQGEDCDPGLTDGDTGHPLGTRGAQGSGKQRRRLYGPGWAPRDPEATPASIAGSGDLAISTCHQPALGVGRGSPKAEEKDGELR